jgi:hypothetical protein
MESAWCYYLPDDFIANTNVAFETNGKRWADLDRSKPYVGPQLSPNQFGCRLYLRNPWQYRLDLAVQKRTRIGERGAIALQANFLNALNLANFTIANNPGNASFGRTTTALNDFSGSADPGSRLIEFRLRVSF